MVTALKVTNYLGDELNIDPFNPESSGFLIAGIQGITPIKADINFTNIVTNDGALFNSARIGTRNITMRLVYYPHPTIEETRLLSYKYFPVKKSVKLNFETETRKAEITGYVESNDINIFTGMEYSSISILCPDPFFYSTDEDSEIDVKFSGTVPKFRFSFPSTQDPNVTKPKMIFSNIKVYNQKSIQYNGESEIGMEITIRAYDTVGNITIYNPDTNESMVITSSKVMVGNTTGIISGDEIVITTYKGNKKIVLIRNGVTTNILNSINRDATWLQLRKGDNTIAFSATSGGANLQVEVRSRTVYEGL